MATEKGYRAECINVGNTVNLTMHEDYYVYPNGKETFYVSRFPYPKRSLLGCYHRLHFRLLEEIPDMENTVAEEIPPVEEVQEVVAAPEIQEQMSLF